MVNYNNGKIYAIRSYNYDKYYIGSTCNTLTKRFSNHKSKYIQYLNNNNHHVSSFDILEHGDCYIELIENYECKDKNELLRREGELIRLHKKDIVNNVIPKRTIKQWRQDNKNVISQKAAIYYKNNKINIIQKSTIYYKNNKIIHNKLAKIRYNKNKDNNKIMCECGRVIMKHSINTHKKSNIHQTYIKNPFIYLCI